MSCHSNRLRSTSNASRPACLNPMRVLCWVGVATLGCALPTEAFELTDGLTVSGYASIGASRINRDDVQFFDSQGDWSFKTDTIFGAQLQYQLNSQWSMTTQIASRGFNLDDSDDFDPVVPWVFVSYQVSPELRLRAGRMRTPFYLYSESLEIGYSYPWVRPPIDTYTPLLKPMANFNGADLTLNLDVHEVDVDVQVFAGVFKGEYYSFDLRFKPVWGANIITYLGGLKLRYGATLAITDASSSDLDPIVAAYRQFSVLDPVFDELADSHSTHGKLFQYHGFGFQYEWHNFSLVSEQFAILGPDDDFANDAYGWYVSLTYSWERFLPYVVVGHHKNIFADDIDNLIALSKQVIPQGTLAQLDALREVDQRVSDDFDDSGFSYVAGMRVDLTSNVAFKGEVHYFDSNSHLREFSTSSPKKGATAVSFVVDMVF